MNLQNMRYVIFLIIEFLSSAFSLESVKACLADQRGGLVLPIDGMPIEDKDLIKYKSLKKDKSLKSINPADLLGDFCDGACKLVDEFRRKTVNAKEEWMMYFDYITGDIIYCWQGNIGESGGGFNREQFRGRHIASLHSHSRGYYSFPSPENFDILENEFEDYESITSINAFWSVEFKGSVGKTIRGDFQINLKNDMDNKMANIKLNYNKWYINDVIEKELSTYLLHEISKKIEDIDLKLIKVGV